VKPDSPERTSRFAIGMAFDLWRLILRMVRIPAGRFNSNSQGELGWHFRKKSAGVPVIASMNGSSPGEWLSYAEELQAAGADALEFNLQSAIFRREETANEIESRLVGMIRDICDRVSIPVAVKISQRYTSLAFMTWQLTQAGANVVMVTSTVYREGPDAIRKIVDGVKKYIEMSRFPTLRGFQESLPRNDVSPDRTMRLEHVDPLIRDKTYFTPMPAFTPTTGDSYGHQT